MANRKKKRRPRNRPGTSRSDNRHGAGSGAEPTSRRKGAAETGSTSEARRERKERARKAREAERKKASRSAAIRRAAIFSGVGLGVFGVLLWLQRAAAPRPLPQAATAAIDAAGCRYDSSPTDGTLIRDHLASGGTTAYPSVPATSGAHDPSPLPFEPRVYDVPVPETRAVHFLEHSGVIAYYRANGGSALAQPVVDRLTSLVNASKNTILAPRTDLPDDTSFAVTAWNKVVDCGSDVTPDQAAAITSGFIEAFSCTSNAPESQNGEGC